MRTVSTERLWTFILVAGMAPVVLHAADQVVAVGPEGYAPISAMALSDLKQSAGSQGLSAQAILRNSALIHRGRPIIQGTPEIVSQADESLQTLSLTTPESTLQVSSGTGGTSPVYVYTKLFSSVHFNIVDQGYDLNAEDLTKFQTLLDRLPASQLAGIKDIIFRGGSADGTSETSPGHLVIAQGGKISDPAYQWVTEWDLAAAVGVHRYNQLLSPEAQQDFQDAYVLAYGATFPLTGWDYGISYANYIYNSNDALQSGVGDSQQTTSDAHKTLPLALIFASAFAQAQGAVTDFFHMDLTGVTSQEYASAYVTATEIVIGSYHFDLVNGQITGYSSPGTAHVSFTPPIPVPPSIFSQLAKK